MKRSITYYPHSLAHRLLVAVLCLCAIEPLYAQQGTNDQVIIIKEYDAKVKEADKINLSPNITEEDDKMPKLTYKVPQRDLKDIAFEPNPLKPLGMSTDKMERFNSSYIKIGFGSQLSPLVELMYNNNGTKNLRYGFFYDHFSQYGFHITNQKYSDDKLGAYLHYYPAKSELSTAFTFHNLRTHFYGSPDTTYDGAAIRQNLRDYDFTLRFRNIQKNSIGLDYATAIRGNYMQETYGSGNEYFVNGNLLLSHTFKKPHTLYGDFEFDVSGYNTAVQNTFRHLFWAGLGYSFNNDNWKARIAFKLGIDNGTVYALPDLYLEKRLYEHKFIAFVGWEINLQKNSFKTLTERNNYLQSNIDLNNTRTSDLYGGLKGTISAFSYNIRIAYKNISNMPFYYTNYFDTKRFYVSYDPRVNDFNAQIELGYNHKDKLRIAVLADINTYSPLNNSQAWYEPVLKTDIKASYIFAKKIIVGIDLYAFSSYSGFLSPGITRTTAGTADLSLNLEYIFSKRLSFFGTLNNIAHQRYERWAYYPVYGINGLVGAKFAF